MIRRRESGDGVEDQGDRGEAGHRSHRDARRHQCRIAVVALGEDAGPIIASMKAMVPEIKKRSLKGRDAKTFQTALEAVTKAIGDHEKQYSVVKPSTSE